MKGIILIGAGGHCKVIIDLIRQRERVLGEEIKVVGILDGNIQLKDKLIMGVPILGTLTEIENLKDDYMFVITIGANNIRKKISLEFSNIQYYSAIHPSAIIGEEVEIEPGCMVLGGAIINSGTTIGKHTIINSGAIVEHDNRIGDFVHISPGVSIAGGVTVGNLSWLGIGSTVIQGISIGECVTIGAGSVVIRDIKSNSKNVGNPTREI